MAGSKVLARPLSFSFVARWPYKIFGSPDVGVGILGRAPRIGVAAQNSRPTESLGTCWTSGAPAAIGSGPGCLGGLGATSTGEDEETFFCRWQTTMKLTHSLIALYSFIIYTVIIKGSLEVLTSDYTESCR